MSSTNKELKIWFPTPTETDAPPEALTEAVRRAVERQARRAHRKAQSHKQVQLTPFQLQRDTKTTCSIIFLVSVPGQFGMSSSQHDFKLQEQLYRAMLILGSFTNK